MESNVEEVDWYEEEKKLRAEGEAAKQLNWEVQDVRSVMLGEWLGSEVDSPGSEGNIDMQGYGEGSEEEKEEEVRDMGGDKSEEESEKSTESGTEDLEELQDPDNNERLPKRPKLTK